MESQAQAMCSTPRRRALEQGQAHWPEATVAAKTFGSIRTRLQMDGRAIWQSILTLPPMLMVSFRAPRADYC